MEMQIKLDQVLWKIQINLRAPSKADGKEEAKD